MWAIFGNFVCELLRTPKTKLAEGHSHGLDPSPRRPQAYVFPERYRWAVPVVGKAGTRRGTLGLCIGALFLRALPLVGVLRGPVREGFEPLAHGARDGVWAFEGREVAAVIYLNQTRPRYPVG